MRAGDFANAVASLSGGNQQKVILGTLARAAMRILVFVEPTRGVDIAAKAAVYETMRRFADAGHAILVVFIGIARAHRHFRQDSCHA